MNCDDLADHQAAAGGCGREIENLMQLAFEADRGFGDSGRSHDLRGFRLELGEFEFVHGWVVFAAGRIHGFAKIIGNDVDDEFAGLANVVATYLSLRLGSCRAPGLISGWPHPRRKRQQRRVDANAIEKRKRRKVRLAGSAYGRYPRDGARGHGVEQDAVKVAVREV